MPGARGPPPPPPPPLARSGTRRPPARPAVALTSTPASSLRMAMELGGALCRTPAGAGVGSDENARPGGASTRAPAEPGAAYRPPLRAIQIQPTPNGLEFRAAGKTPARVGAVTTPLRPTNIPAPGKLKPVLRSGFSTTGATRAQLQRSKNVSSTWQQRDSHAPAKEGNSSEHTLSLQLELDITKTILLEEVKARVEAETKQVCLIKQIEELKKKRDQETLMLKTELEQERQAMGEAAEAITSLINQLDACNEKEMEDEGIKGSETKRAARQLLLSFLKTASEEELQTMKEIGEKRARMILELREQSPEVFASVKDVLDSIEMRKQQVSNMMWDIMVGP